MKLLNGQNDVLRAEPFCPLVAAAPNGGQVILSVWRVLPDVLPALNRLILQEKSLLTGRMINKFMSIYILTKHTVEGLKMLTHIWGVGRRSFCCPSGRRGCR